MVILTVCDVILWCALGLMIALRVAKERKMKTEIKRGMEGGEGEGARVCVRERVSSTSQT